MELSLHQGDVHFNWNYVFMCFERYSNNYNKITNYNYYSNNKYNKKRPLHSFYYIYFSFQILDIFQLNLPYIICNECDLFMFLNSVWENYFGISLLRGYIFKRNKVSKRDCDYVLFGYIEHMYLCQMSIDSVALTWLATKQTY